MTRPISWRSWRRGTVVAIDATAADLLLVRSILSRCLSDREVRVMGSRITGHPKPFSDLDLVVMGDVPLDLATLADLREALDESRLSFAVDLVEWATASEGFRRVITAEARPFVQPAPARSPQA